MKNYYLFCLVILLFFRIKDTPMELSKTLWLKSIEKRIQKTTKKNEKYEELEKKALMKMTGFIEFLLICFYIYLGLYVKNQLFFILSIAEVATCIMNYNSQWEDVDAIFGNDISLYTFRRGQQLFNVMLDYVYYIMAFCLLLR